MIILSDVRIDFSDDIGVGSFHTNLIARYIRSTIVDQLKESKNLKYLKNKESEAQLVLENMYLESIMDKGEMKP